LKLFAVLFLVNAPSLVPTPAFESFLLPPKRSSLGCLWGLYGSLPIVVTLVMLCMIEEETPWVLY